MEEQKSGLEAALDELVKGKKTEEIVGPNGLLKQLTKALLERAMNAELTHHLGYEKGQAEGRGSGNNRNGNSRKRVQGDFGAVEIAIPRDRNGSFEPQVLPKHERRWTGFDDKIISMYARGMSTRDIEAHLREIYGVEVSATLISQVTEEVMEEVRAWQSRPLEALYMMVYLDALVSRCGMRGEWRTGRCSWPFGTERRSSRLHRAGLHHCPRRKDCCAIRFPQSKTLVAPAPDANRVASCSHTPKLEAAGARFGRVLSPPFRASPTQGPSSI